MAKNLVNLQVFLSFLSGIRMSAVAGQLSEAFTGHLNCTREIAIY